MMTSLWWSSSIIFSADSFSEPGARLHAGEHLYTTPCFLRWSTRENFLLVLRVFLNLYPSLRIWWDD